MAQRYSQLKDGNYKSTSIIMDANNGLTYIIGVRAGKSDNYFSFGPITYSAPSGPYTTAPSPPSPSLSAGSVTDTSATLTISQPLRGVVVQGGHGSALDELLEHRRLPETAST